MPWPSARRTMLSSCYVQQVINNCSVIVLHFAKNESERKIWGIFDRFGLNSYELCTCLIPDSSNIYMSPISKVMAENMISSDGIYILVYRWKDKRKHHFTFRKIRLTPLPCTCIKSEKLYRVIKAISLNLRKRHWIMAVYELHWLNICYRLY